MSPPSDDHRAAIIRRRAVFLSSALAAVGCTPRGGEPAPAGPTPVVSIPEPTATADPEPTSEPQQPAPKPTSTDRPSYELPAGLTQTAEQNYQRLHDNLKQLHGQLDDMERKLSQCDLTQPACEQTFREQADTWHEIQRTLRFMYFCPGKSDEAKAFEKHRAAHDAHLRARIASVEQRVNDAAGDPARWEQIKTEQAKPTPCLSFACPDW